MARYDQVEPHVGILRAILAADLTPEDDGTYGPTAVSLDTNGRVVEGTAGQSGFVGVLVKNLPTLPAGLASTGAYVNNWMGLKAGQAVDVMQLGEILDVDGLDAGTQYYAAPDGSLTDDPDGGANPKVGFTVEATRLVIQPGVGLSAWVSDAVATSGS